MRIQHYFSKRWKAKIPFRDLFWRELIVRGTLINLLVAFLGLMLIAQGYPSLWAAIAHLVILPYNIFLVLAILRWPGVKSSFKAVAGVWLVLTSLA